MKPAEAPIIVAMTKGIGAAPTAAAAAIATGNIRTAAALLVTSSVNTTVATYTSTRVVNGSPAASAPSCDAASAATPLFSSAAPSANEQAITTIRRRSTLR